MSVFFFVKYTETTEIDTYGHTLSLHASPPIWADSERRWRNTVHIGIGGSDWGVRLAVTAFGYAGTWRQVHFVANIDGHAIQGGLAGLDPHDKIGRAHV